MENNNSLKTCPCCGYKTLEKGNGNYEICPVCFWEDDASQSANPDSTGANDVTLKEAQENFQYDGVSQSKFANDVRDPLPEEIKDPDWKPVIKDINSD